MMSLAKTVMLISFSIGMSCVAAVGGEYTPIGKTDARYGGYRFAQSQACHCTQTTSTAACNNCNCVQASGTCPPGLRCGLWSSSGFEHVAACIK
jgi:hypothetical protein